MAQNNAQIQMLAEPTDESLRLLTEADQVAETFGGVAKAFGSLFGYSEQFVEGKIVEGTEEQRLGEFTKAVQKWRQRISYKWDPRDESAWQKLQPEVDKYQSEFIDVLNEVFEENRKGEVSDFINKWNQIKSNSQIVGTNAQLPKCPTVAEVKLHVLEGAIGPEIEELGRFDVFGSYARQYYDYAGRTTSNREIPRSRKYNHPGVPPPMAFPSLEDFCVQKNLDAMVQAAKDDENTYVIQLQQMYYCHVRDTNTQWCSVTVLLSVRMSAGTFTVIQVAASEPDENGVADIQGTDLTGSEVTAVRTKLDSSDVEWLRTQFSDHLGQSPRRLRLVFPDGTASAAKHDSTQLTKFFH